MNELNIVIYCVFIFSITYIVMYCWDSVNNLKKKLKTIEDFIEKQEFKKLADTEEATKKIE